MAEEYKQQPAEKVQKSDEITIPIDIKTILIAVKHKLLWFAAIALIAGALGIVGALNFSSKEYSSTTVLYYQPVASYLSDTFQVYQSVGDSTSLTYDQGAQLVRREGGDTSIWTMVSMVEIIPNFEAFRERLQLPMSLDQIRRMFNADAEEDTKLIFINARNEDPEKAALYANTLRDIYIENTRKMAESDMDTQIRDLQSQLESVKRERDLAKQELLDFIKNEGFQDINLENLKYSEEFINLDLKLKNHAIERDTLAAKVKKIKEAIDEAEKRFETPAPKVGVSGSVGLTPDEVSAKIVQLQEQVLERRNGLINTVTIEQKYDAMKRAEEQFEKGKITEDALVTARNEYDLVLAQLADSTELDSLVKKIDDYRNVDVIGTGESLANSDFLKEMRLQLLEAEIMLTQAEQTYEGELALYESLKPKVEKLPILANDYKILVGKNSSLEAEYRGLEKMYNQALTAKSLGVSDFLIISDAMVPIYPIGSNTKIIAIAIAFLVFMTGSLIILLRILFDTRIKSAGDVKQKLQVPVLGVLPYLRSLDKLYPTLKKDSEHIELYRIMARPLRRHYPASGTAYLVTSTAPGEGKSIVASNLAAVFGRQDERVLILDAQVRKSRKRSSFERIQFDSSEEVKQDTYGLGEYLSFMANELEEIVQPTILPGVDLIPMLGEAVIPDLLQSMRMKELISILKERYTIIIIEAPPAGESVDAEVLAQYCDTILMVTGANGIRPEPARKALARLYATECPVEGIVLTGVTSAYL